MDGGGGVGGAQRGCLKYRRVIVWRVGKAAKKKRASCVTQLHEAGVMAAAATPSKPRNPGISRGRRHRSSGGMTFTIHVWVVGWTCAYRSRFRLPPKRSKAACVRACVCIIYQTDDIRFRGLNCLSVVSSGRFALHCVFVRVGARVGTCRGPTRNRSLLSMSMIE